MKLLAAVALVLTLPLAFLASRKTAIRQMGVGVVKTVAA